MPIIHPSDDPVSSSLTLPRPLHWDSTRSNHFSTQRWALPNRCFVLRLDNLPTSYSHYLPMFAATSLLSPLLLLLLEVTLQTSLLDLPCIAFVEHARHLRLSPQLPSFAATLCALSSVLLEWPMSHKMLNMPCTSQLLNLPRIFTCPIRRMALSPAQRLSNAFFSFCHAYKQTHSPEIGQCNRRL